MGNEKTIIESLKTQRLNEGPRAQVLVNSLIAQLNKVQSDAGDLEDALFSYDADDKPAANLRAALAKSTKPIDALINALHALDVQ